MTIPIWLVPLVLVVWPASLWWASWVTSDCETESAASFIFVLFTLGWFMADVMGALIWIGYWLGGR